MFTNGAARIRINETTATKFLAIGLHISHRDNLAKGLDWDSSCRF